MASNYSTVQDEDGDYSDWIELYNPTQSDINLDGWYFTDDADDLTKWEFPSIYIGSDDFLLVFASGKNRRDPDGELHTNFQLRAGGEFLALVESDGRTVVQMYDNYPPQYADLSYGSSNFAGGLGSETILVPESAQAKALIPTDGSLGLRWTEPGFDDSSWLSGTTGVGYDYPGLIGLDVGAMRYNNQTVYARISFGTSSILSIDRLTLRMKFEDGFVAYINGIPVASYNADDPESMSWDEGSTANRDDSLAIDFEDFDITDHIGALRVGNNVLAIHGLNAGVSSSDLLILPQLAATSIDTTEMPSTVEGYLYEPTPGRQNSGISTNLGPAISNVTEYPPQPLDNENLIITATLIERFAPVASATLAYRTNYGQEARRTMVDNGTGGDAAAGDGIYTGIIPASAAGPGQMIRWKVEAQDTQNNSSHCPLYPRATDSPEYFGTVVKDTSINTQLPVIEWFVQNVGASETDNGTRGSVYYLGEFYDNVGIHRRGGSTAGQPKTHFKFNFNHGYKFMYDPNCPRVNEFNLNSTFSDKAYIRQSLAFEAYDWCGCPASISFVVRAQRNGRFHGVYVFIEEPEEELLEREGLDPNGALYKMYSTFTSPGEKKTRLWENSSDLSDFISSINNMSGTTLHNNIFDQVNLPLTLDYLSATILVHQNDHPHKNHYLYRDSDGSGEWFFLPWDHDLTWGSNWTGSSYHDYIYAADDQVSGKPSYVKPSHPFVGKEDCQEWNFHWNHLIDALFNDATVREMYLRRLRTVMDKFLKAPGTPYNELFIEKRIDELVEQMAPDVALDYNKWANPWPWGGQGGYPRDQSFQYAIDILKNDYLEIRRRHLFITHNVDNRNSYNIPGSYSALIPNAQPANPQINFADFEYNPSSGNQDEEYIQLVNPNSYAVDISGWKLTGGVKHKFLPGTVIVAGGSLYVSPNSAAFRNRSGSPRGGQGLFVQGNYKGHLSSWGQTVNLLNDNGDLVGTLTYTGNPSIQQRFLRITELMYNPPDSNELDPQEYEYIELKNIGPIAISLSSVKFTDGILYDFPNINLAAGGYILVVKNPNAFSSRYTVPNNVSVLGPYDGQLSNSGENIKLEDPTNSTIMEFSYDDNWYDSTDGMGFSLTATDPAGTEPNAWSEKDSWKPSTDIWGSPGRDDIEEISRIGKVVINELLAHSHDVAPDWIELYNTTDIAINLGGWYLSDSDINIAKYEIAEGTIIEPNSYVVFYEDLNFGNLNDPGCHEPFGLSENGEIIYLHSAYDGILTGYSDDEDFGASETGISFGRFRKSTGTYNFVSMSENTPGSANAYPLVGPVVINEIMYNPGSGDQDEEYIELLNISDSLVLLSEYDSELFVDIPWRINDSSGISFDFPTETFIAPGECLLLVKDRNTFNARYPSVDSNVQILEWGAGRLSNSGEQLQLSKPGEQMDGIRYYIRLDRVNYSDGAHPDIDDPWPTEADGGGFSLTRKVSHDYGNDVNNWSAEPPSPGR